MSKPGCLFCTQPQVESLCLFLSFSVNICDEHKANLDQLHASIDRYLDYLAKSYSIVVMRAAELKVGDMTHWQQYPVKVNEIKVEPSSTGGVTYEITLGLPECFSWAEKQWSRKIIRSDNELCIKLIEYL